MVRLPPPSDERVRTLTRRLRGAGMIGLVSIGTFALVDLRGGMPSPAFGALRLIQMSAALAAILFTRRLRPWSDVANATLLFIGVLVFSAAAMAVLRNETESVPVLLTMTVLACAAFTGWGFRHQMAMVFVGLTALLANVLGTGTLGSIAPYPLLPLLCACAVSLYVAAESDRHAQARHVGEVALRESETLFRTLTEEAPVPIWMSDARGDVTYLNPAWSTLLGTPREETKTDTIWAALHAEDRPGLARMIRQTRTAWEGEYRVLAPGGTRWLSFRGVPRCRADGTYAGHVGTAIDVTDRKAEALQLAASRNAAIEAARLKSNFLATMSHEIRTPMHGIFGMTELALDADDDGERREYLERARRCAITLMTLLDEILDLSRIEAGRLELADEAIDLREVVQNAVDTVAPAASTKGLELIVDVDADVPASIRGDSARLRQVMTNLLGNAVKFTARGEVEVTAMRAPQSHNILLLQVRDTGIGIDPESASRIFEPFTQAHAQVAQRSGGTGLGLAITKQLVAKMRGSIRVESTPGAGATLRVYLPMRDPVAHHVDRLLDGWRIVLADDNERSRRAMRRLLESHAGHVVGTSSGREALDVARDLADAGMPPDALILDVEMPDLGSVAVVRELDAHPILGRTPVLLLTPLAPQHAGDRRPSQHRTLTKPVQAEPLVRLLLETRAALPATGS